MSVSLDAQIAQDIQTFEPGEIVVLFELNLTPIGGSFTRFSANTLVSGADIVFDGNTYTAAPIKATGFEMTFDKTLAEPSLAIANVDNVIGALVIANDDLRNAKVKRIRTFRKYLDGEASADPNAIFPIDLFIIDQKVMHTKQVIEFKLVSPIGQEGIKLPRRQILHDTCTHRYRFFDTGTQAFVYTNASCPYNDVEIASHNGNLVSPPAYFKPDGTITSDPSLDFCGKKLSDCKLRFGDNGNLPTRAFPAAGSFR